LGTNVDIKGVEDYLPSHFPVVLMSSSVFTVRKKTRLPWEAAVRESRSKWRFRKCCFQYSRCWYLHCRDWGAGKWV